MVEEQFPRPLEQIVELLAGLQHDGARQLELGGQLQAGRSIGLEGGVWQALVREVGVDTLSVCADGGRQLCDVTLRHFD